MKKWLAGAVLTMCAAAFPAIAGDDLSIGVVDFGQVFEQVPQGHAKLESLKRALAPTLDELKGKQEKIAKDLADLRRDAPTLDEKTRAEREEALFKRQQAFETEVVEIRNKEMEKEREATSAFEADLVKAVDRLADEGDFDLVLNKQAVPFVSTRLDLTKKVIAILNGEGSTDA